MKIKIEQIKTQVTIAILVQIAILAAFVFFYGVNIGALVASLFILLEGIIIYYIISVFEKVASTNLTSINEIVGNEAQEALIVGKMGLIVYDADYRILWMSEYFEKLKINKVGELIGSFIPELADLFRNDVDVMTVNYHDYYFRVHRHDKTRLIYFEDITDEFIITEKYYAESLVMGLVHIDNYIEYTQYEEEQTIYFIDSIVKQTLIKWADDNEIFIKRLRTDRYLLLMTDDIFANVLKRNFQILHTIRRESQNNDLAITLSMAFARGTSDFVKLDEMTNELLELAQSRGGDQVTVRTYGDEIKYYGGQTESRERASKVRVRVMAQTIRELIKNSDKVIISGHQNADFDSMGSALGMSRIVASYNKDVYIIASGGIEEKLTAALKQYDEHLQKRHLFIEEKEAKDLVTFNTLLILVDHHIQSQSAAENLIDYVNNIVVIDHHRRTSDFTYQPVLNYIESAASSVTELVMELIPYQEGRVNISVEEATLMLTGMIVDTNNFKNRTSSRTFEAASMLKRIGANTIEADRLLEDPYDEFSLKNSIMNRAEFKEEGIVFAPVYQDIIVSRGIISQVADELLSIKESEAVFVISKIDEERVGISARSKGNINVQVIMEAMDGGGHFSAAAVQKSNTSVEALEDELEKVVENYIQEVEKNESNFVK